MRSFAVLVCVLMITACGRPHSAKTELQPKNVEPKTQTTPSEDSSTSPAAAEPEPVVAPSPEVAPPAPTVSPEPSAPAATTPAQGTGMRPRVREQLEHYQAKTHENVDINNAGFLGHAGISFIINKPECTHLLNGDIVSYQFKGDYLQKWSTFTTQVSIKSVTEITGVIDIQVDSSWHEDVELHFRNDGKSSTKSTGKGRGFSLCFTKLGECNATLAALDSEVAQIEKKPLKALDDRQKNTLLCLKGLATTFKNATSEIKKAQ